MYKFLFIFLSPVFLILSSCDSSDTDIPQVINKSNSLTQPSISTYQWNFQSNGKIRSSAVTDEQKVYFGNNAGELYALDKMSGELI